MNELNDKTVPNMTRKQLGDALASWGTEARIHEVLLAKALEAIIESDDPVAMAELYEEVSAAGVADPSTYGEWHNREDEGGFEPPEYGSREGIAEYVA